MKKILALLLALSMLFALTACGGDNESIPTGESTGETTNTSETTNDATDGMEDSTQGTTESTTGGDTTETTELPTTTSPTTTLPATTPPTAEAPHTHSYSSKVTTAATCGKDGVKTFTCFCGHSYTEKIAATGQHSYRKTVTNATCTVQGYTMYTCPCGDTYTADYVNPTHNYSNYKCTKCGAIDKTHSYEYLIEWVKSNGVADGSHINFDYYSNSGEYTRYSLTYDATNRYLYINKGFYYQGVYGFNSLRLDTYSCFASFDDCEVGGYIDANSFTANSPISCSYYKGDNSAKWDMIEMARLSTNELVEWLGWCLSTYVVV